MLSNKSNIFTYTCQILELLENKKKIELYTIMNSVILLEDLMVSSNFTSFSLFRLFFPTNHINLSF